jgi:hypothetical protein
MGLYLIATPPYNTPDNTPGLSTRIKTGFYKPTPFDNMRDQAAINTYSSKLAPKHHAPLSAVKIKRTITVNLSGRLDRFWQAVSFSDVTLKKLSGLKLTAITNGQNY